ncbi:MAG TPA: gamma-glutamyltransferase [Candidatus Sulfotelmatobacter sp.]|nr:gamma-glutamyltransferase [Candidatus Sulfotelmatobacter sp.]
MIENFSRTLEITKKVVRSTRGVVSAQNQLAADIGAKVLAEGGNAVDAAVAVGFAIPTVEPWMSGMGGGGYMVVYSARTKKVSVVDFGLVTAAGLDPADYPLVAGTGGDIFGWPAVKEDRNLKGYPSIAVPGQVAGMALALETFGTWEWRRVLAPAIAQAERGLLVDWFASLKIAAAAPDFARFATSAATYLVGGHYAPFTPELGEPLRLKLGGLGETLKRLAEAGPRDFYEGKIAAALARDLAAGGSKITLDDLGRYRARLVEPLAFDHAGVTVNTVPGLTAGPTLQKTLQAIGGKAGKAPDAAWYSALAAALLEAYRERFATMGDTRGESCTTHFNVVDAEGNMVALTQTLLSLFGSKVMLPETGIMMNNGLMWFDTRPDQPNSIGAGKRPLANMCPVIVTKGSEPRFAVGASGGRRIMPAVAQLISFLTTFGMSLEEAFHAPRIDVSGVERIVADHRLPADVFEALAAKQKTVAAPRTVYPVFYACPSAVARERGEQFGIAEISLPWTAAAGA